MQTVTIQEAQQDLKGLIQGLKPGEELVITEQDQPIARLVAVPPRPREPRQPGGAQGQLFILKEDDEHLEDFKEYMP